MQYWSFHLSRKQGQHLPTSPPVPQELQEAYARFLADPRSQDGDDGQYHPERQG